MKKTIALTFFALLALFSSNAFAVDQVTVSPPNPREGDTITISFRTTQYELVDGTAWELSGSGAVRDLNVIGVDYHPLDPPPPSLCLA